MPSHRILMTSKAGTIPDIRTGVEYFLGIAFLMIMVMGFGVTGRLGVRILPRSKEDIR